MVDDLRADDGEEENEENDASQGYPSSPDIPARVVTIAVLVNIVTAIASQCCSSQAHEEACVETYL
jgi:hypothetical protein